MTHTSLLQEILEVCRGREFNSVEDLSPHIPDASPHVIEATVIGAIRRGLLGGRINEQRFLDGPVVTVSYIRG